MLHRSLFVLATVAVLFTGSLAQKRPLTHQDFDSWKSIQSPQISRDGNWVAYALMPQDGDGEIVVHHSRNAVEWRTPRGYRPPVPPPDPSDPSSAPSPANNARLVRPFFTADSRYLVFTIEPTKAELAKARKEKKKPEEMPKNALAIQELSSGKISRIENVKGFQVAEDGSDVIVYQLEARPEPKAPDTKADTAKPSDDDEDLQQGARGQRAASGRSRRKEFGTDLVIYHLADGKTRVLPEVLDYTLSKDAKTLLFAISARKEESNGLFAADTSGDAAPVEIIAGRGRYNHLTWNEEQTSLAFLSDRDDAQAKQPHFKVYSWDRKSGGKATELLSDQTPGVRKGLIVSDRGSLSYSMDGSRLFVSMAPPPEPEKEADSEEPADEKVLVDLWHYKDDFIQPMQKVRAESDRNRTFRAMVNLKDGKFLQLADEKLESVNPAIVGDWALGTDDRPYRTLVGRDSNFSDAYLVSLTDGSRKRILEKAQFGVSWSPSASYAVYFDGKDWFSIAVPSGKVTNLTARIESRFWREDNDTPSTPGSYGIAGWLKGDKAVLLYDKYDIWQVSPDGSAVTNVTGGLGRKNQISLRYIRLDAERGPERGIDPGATLLLGAENQESHDTGFYRTRLGNPGAEKLVMGPKSFGMPIKARDAEVVVFSQSKFDEFPDLYVSSLSFTAPRKISNGGDQMKPFLWGTSELVKFKSTDGIPLSGVLIKPDNFDPTKKYPMIVYIYEKLSNTVHQFTPPAPGHNINRTYYASNGYLILLPDIVYEIGYPGPSALKCVLPAVQAVVDKGYVNENAIGIQGHSWGGYQIAYMVTQTNRFKAAAPGALVANMTSAYSGIRWGTGLSRQFQYEWTQSRIGGSLWDYPMRFIENSPVFRADKVQTPILMIANDNDDAVPWYQGIEFYLALRRFDKEVYMFSYNGEFHGLRRRPDQKDYARRLQEFFDNKLKNGPKPEWMEKGIPYLEREKEKEKYKTAVDAKQ